MHTRHLNDVFSSWLLLGESFSICAYQLRSHYKSLNQTVIWKSICCLLWTLLSYELSFAFQTSGSLNICQVHFLLILYIFTIFIISYDFGSRFLYRLLFFCFNSCLLWVVLLMCPYFARFTLCTYISIDIFPTFMDM